MPKNCEACGMRLRKDKSCFQKSCGRFKPILKDGRGSWLKALMAQTPRRVRALKATPLAKRSVQRLSACKQKRRIRKKSAAIPLSKMADPASPPKSDNGLECAVGSEEKLPGQVDLKQTIGSDQQLVLPIAEQKHSDELDAQVLQADEELMRDFVTDELLAGPLVPAAAVRQQKPQQQFFNLTVRPSASMHCYNVRPLAAIVCQQMEKLVPLVGEASALRFLAQISTVLSRVPPTASLVSVTAYAAACFMIAFECVGSAEDEKCKQMYQFITDKISSDIKNVNRCLMQLLTWMGQRR